MNNKETRLLSTARASIQKAHTDKKASETTVDSMKCVQAAQATIEKIKDNHKEFHNSYGPAITLIEKGLIETISTYKEIEKNLAIVTREGVGEVEKGEAEMSIGFMIKNAQANLNFCLIYIDAILVNVKENNKQSAERN